MKRRYAGFLTALTFSLVGCGIVSIPGATPKHPPEHLQAFLPHGTRLTGHAYFPHLATEVVWGERSSEVMAPLRVALIQQRHGHWRVVYRHQWSNAVAMIRVTQYRNPHVAESALVLALATGGNDGYTTLANFLVSPTRVTFVAAPGGIGGVISVDDTGFRETFAASVEQFTWQHKDLVALRKGPLSTIPVNAVTRSVFVSAAQPNPNISGSLIIHVQPGQPFAIRPATAYGISAFEKGQLGLFGPFTSWNSATNAAIDDVNTIPGLWTTFKHSGVYYLDVVSNSDANSSPYQVLTIIVGNVPAPPPPQATVTFGTGFQDATFSLTGTSKSFAPTSDVHWLLSNPGPLSTTTVHEQLYQQNGEAETLVSSQSVTVDPQDSELENTIDTSAGPLGTGTYQLIFVIGNKVIGSGTFTIQ